MDDMKVILHEEVRKYAGSGRGLNLRLFPMLDDDRHNYTVVAVDDPIRDQWDDYAGVVVLARLVGDIIVVEVDATDKPLVDALLQRGVPRDKIVLAYAGEPRPDPTPDA